MTAAVLEGTRPADPAATAPVPPGRGGIPVLLLDPDPISRHVLTGVLAGSCRVSLLAAVDPGATRSRTGRSRDPGVAVLCPGNGDEVVGEVRALRSRGTGVIVLGSRWTREAVCGALAAGAGACLVKEPGAPGLVDAVVAVHAGHRVLAPALLRALVDPVSPSPAADPGAVRRVSLLSRREREVLAVLAQGAGTEEAARRLCVSRATVKSHVSHALTKLGVRSRLEAVLLLRSVLG